MRLPPLACAGSGNVWRFGPGYALSDHRVGGIAMMAPGGLRTHANRSGERATPATHMKILDIPQSGKLGTYVSVRTRYGQIRRRRGVIRKSPSPTQLHTRATFGRIRALWRTLTEDQRAAWKSDICATSSRPRLGKSGRLPGYLVFMKVNATLALQGQPPVLTPTERPTFDANPVSDLLITNTGGAVDLQLGVPSVPTADILVLGAAPCSAGVSFAKHFVILGRLSAAEAGYSNITKLYVDRYGALTPGKRIFIRTRQVRDGWTELPIQTTALVPKP